MPHSVACSIHDQLVVRLEALFLENMREVVELGATHGLVQAERLTQNLRDACDAARQAVHDHDNDHGCQFAWLVKRAS